MNSTESSESSSSLRGEARATAGGRKRRVIGMSPDGGAIFDLRGTPTRVVAIRDDTRYVSEQLAHSLAGLGVRHVSDPAAVFAECYADFRRKVHDLLAECVFEGEDPVEVHVHCPESLAAAVRERSRGLPIVSLDPMLGGDVTHLGVSRLYYLGGSKSAGATARPGWKSLSRQYELLSEQFEAERICLVDDDLYTGGTARAIIQRIGSRVELFVPQILVAPDGRWPDLGVEVSPVMEYRVSSREQIEISDVRDFLVGASGLVVRLPSGALGRAPYLHPFASPAARANIDRREERRFSESILEANIELFADLEAALGSTITVGRLQPEFVTYAKEVLGITERTPMRLLLESVLASMDGEWQRTEILGNVHEAVSETSFPRSVVFVDVNGTLFPDDSDGASLSDGARSRLGEAARDLASAGISVGLCSDSPLEPLEALARSIGFDGPILAENGLVLSYRGVERCLRLLPEEDELRRTLAAIAPRNVVPLPDCHAPEFGGPSLALRTSAWAFGKGRRATLSVFGPPETISRMGSVVAGREGIDADVSPGYGFLGLYPLDDFRAGKALALSALARLGFSVAMIGNSESDWVAPESGVLCAFVREARMNEEMRLGAFAVAGGSYHEGVVELLGLFAGRSVEGGLRESECRLR